MIGDAALCFCNCDQRGWNLGMRLDLLERGIRELYVKYSRAKNGGRMQIWWPFEISSVAGGRIGFQHLEDLNLISCCSSMMWAMVVSVVAMAHHPWSLSLHPHGMSALVPSGIGTDKHRSTLYLLLWKNWFLQLWKPNTWFRRVCKIKVVFESHDAKWPPLSKM